MKFFKIPRGKRGGQLEDSVSGGETDPALWHSGDKGREDQLLSAALLFVRTGRGQALASPHAPERCLQVLGQGACCPALQPPLVPQKGPTAAKPTASASSGGSGQPHGHPKGWGRVPPARDSSSGPALSPGVA